MRTDGMKPSGLFEGNDRQKPFVVEWDEEHDEPFITVRPGVRLTPYRREDVDARTVLFNTPDVRDVQPEEPIPCTREYSAKRIDLHQSANRHISDQLRRGQKEVNGNPFIVVREWPSGIYMGMMTTGPSGPTSPAPIPGPFDYRRPWTNTSYDIGYGVLPRYRGRGLSQSASEALLEGFLWPRMRLRAVGASVAETNLASIHIMEQSGFEECYAFKGIDRFGAFDRKMLKYVRNRK